LEKFSCTSILGFSDLGFCGSGRREGLKPTPTLCGLSIARDEERILKKDPSKMDYRGRTWIRRGMLRF
jgi:hypothetical protein